MPQRPSPRETPPGHQWEASPDPGWDVGAAAGKRCRFVGGIPRQPCHAPAVAALNRARRGNEPAWWAYCAEHMYGRWIEDGQVMGWRLVRVTDA